MTSSDPRPRTLAAKLARAAKACSYVQKDGHNTFHKYRYASAAAILEHVNEAICDAGLAVVGTAPRVLTVEGSGKDRIVTVEMTLTVADTESDERATFVGLGSGMDSGDKAVMKAQTAATKYAWTMAFSISTGDDPEADAETDKRTEESRRSNTRGENRRAQREEPRSQAAHAPPSDDALPPALEAFFVRLGEIDLPGESVAVWIKHRPELAALPAPEREAAWKALCERTEVVGQMKNAKVWLKKAIAEEDARRAAAEGKSSDAAA